MGQFEAGAFNGQIWLVAAGGVVFGGWLCDKLCNKLGLLWGYRWPIIVGMAGCALMFLFGAFHANPIVAVAILSLGLAFQQMSDGPYWSASIAIGGHLAGAAGGVMNTGANVMGAVNGVLLVWLAEAYGWQFAMASNAVMALLALALFSPFARTNPSSSTSLSVCLYHPELDCQSTVNTPYNPLSM